MLHRVHSHFSVLDIFIALLFTSLIIIGCSDDNGNPLAGDLAFQIEGEPGVTAFMAISYSTGLEFHGETIDFREIPEDGFYMEELEGGDYDAYQVSANPGDADVDFTLRLVSDGDVLDEATEPDEGSIYTVQYGEFPDFGLE